MIIAGTKVRIEERFGLNPLANILDVREWSLLYILYIIL